MAIRELKRIFESGRKEVRSLLRKNLADDNFLDWTDCWHTEEEEFVPANIIRSGQKYVWRKRLTFQSYRVPFETRGNGFFYCARVTLDGREAWDIASSLAREPQYKAVVDALHKLAPLARFQEEALIAWLKRIDPVAGESLAFNWAWGSTNQLGLRYLAQATGTSPAFWRTIVNTAINTALSKAGYDIASGGFRLISGGETSPTSAPQLPRATEGGTRKKKAKAEDRERLDNATAARWLNTGLVRGTRRRRRWRD